jgi:hypothetical protein
VADNPYHNATHAADVTQTVHYIMYPANASEVCTFTNIDVAASYIAAAAHDVGHPGRNNNFLINSDDKLAIRYNDKSVLESYHTAALFKITLEKDKNIFESFSREDYSNIRKKIVSMILATDVSRHFSDLAKFKTKFSNTFIVQEDNDRIEFMEMMMHASDISNP